MTEAVPSPSRFRFRLTLVVALFAAIFAWQWAVWVAKSIDRQREIDKIETRIKALEKHGVRADRERDVLKRYKDDPSMPPPFDY